MVTGNVRKNTQTHFLIFRNYTSSPCPLFCPRTPQNQFQRKKHQKTSRTMIEIHQKTKKSGAIWCHLVEFRMPGFSLNTYIFDPTNTHLKKVVVFRRVKSPRPWWSLVAPKMSLRDPGCPKMVPPHQHPTLHPPPPPPHPPPFSWFFMVFALFFMVFHETVFQRTGFQRTGHSRLSIGRSRLFRSIGNAMAFSAIPIYWDWAFPMNGFWIFWLNTRAP